jgi:hypothetical protein
VSTPGLLALEPELVARIESALQVPRLKVLTRADLAGIKAASQPAPAVHVVYDGPGFSADGNSVEITERWFTVVVVRNLRSTASGEDARADAGPILDALFNALYGWQPTGVKPLLPVTPPRPGFDAGMGYFPLAWSARLKKIHMPCPGAN